MRGLFLWALACSAAKTSTFLQGQRLSAFFSALALFSLPTPQGNLQRFSC